MARTPITTGLVNLNFDTAVTRPATPQNADAVNGNIVPFTVGSSYGPNKVLIIVTNGDASAHTVILRGGGYTGAPGDAANSGVLPPQNTVFAGSTAGDLSIVVAAGATQVITALTSDRFAQADGSLWIDWSAATSMSLYVYQLPVVVS